MKTYGTTALITLSVFLALAAVMFGASFAGFAGETPMVLAAVGALVTWGTLIGLLVRALVLALAVRQEERSQVAASLTWTRHLLLSTAILSGVGAFVFGFGAFASCGPTWLAGLYHWGGLVGSVLSLGAWFAMPSVVRGLLGAEAAHLHPSGWRAPLITGAIVYGLWGAVWLVAWLVLRGSIEAGAYPSSASSPYRLPFPGGESAWVIQGNNSSLNHNDDEEHAWDFRRQCGSPVLAAREGVVRAVTDTHSGNGGDTPNNFVEVTHSDGTVGRYLHIQKDSAAVAVGDTVNAGDRLARVGNVGNSLTGHIHFVVDQGGRSIPVTFRDVDGDSGIPRTFHDYDSGNR